MLEVLAVLFAALFILALTLEWMGDWVWLLLILAVVLMLVRIAKREGL